MALASQILTISDWQSIELWPETVRFLLASFANRGIGKSKSDSFQSQFDWNLIDADPLEFTGLLGYNFAIDDDKFRRTMAVAVRGSGSAHGSVGMVAQCKFSLSIYR